jgi:hypothetical protein
MDCRRGFIAVTSFHLFLCTEKFWRMFIRALPLHSRSVIVTLPLFRFYRLIIRYFWYFIQLCEFTKRHGYRVVEIQHFEIPNVRCSRVVSEAFIEVGYFVLLLWLDLLILM